MCNHLSNLIDGVLQKAIAVSSRRAIAFVLLLYCNYSLLLKQ
ncbi:hypothetical protein GXM_05551 [Nostoc sphaeroides CCNUC1]|uniref:Uncharacterized protein n=1 Tax=Nostoc sphaeroides CCNUC1 TaxID=2653204 RepID=A0A5P8W7Y6_9NOSO|nr:hypothetical protein GXM_05551 [Nostoc sphaeroides CCNUC1]